MEVNKYYIPIDGNYVAPVKYNGVILGMMNFTDANKKSVNTFAFSGIKVTKTNKEALIQRLIESEEYLTVSNLEKLNIDYD